MFGAATGRWRSSAAASAPHVCICIFNQMLPANVIPYYFKFPMYAPLPVLSHTEDSESVKTTRVNVLQLRNSN